MLTDFLCWPCATNTFYIGAQPNKVVRAVRTTWENKEYPAAKGTVFMKLGGQSKGIKLVQAGNQSVTNWSYKRSCKRQSAGFSSSMVLASS